MRRRFMICLSIVLLIIAFGSLGYAQDNAPGADQGRMGPGQRRGMRMMNPQFMQTMRLMRMVMGIPALMQDKDHALTPSQAKAVLEVLKPLRKQPKLTGDQAKTASVRLEKVFTKAQIELMAIARQRRFGEQRRPGMNNGENGRRVQNAGDGNNDQGRRQWRRGGQGGPGGHFNPSAMKDFNPFYEKAAPNGNGRFGQMMTKRMGDMFKDLEKVAHGK